VASAMRLCIPVAPLSLSWEARRVRSRAAFAQDLLVRPKGA
jgi:hypothetical protein